MFRRTKGTDWRGMQTVLTRLLRPTGLMVGLLVLFALLSALALLMWLGGVNDTEPLVAPFRWEPLRRFG